MPNEPLTQEQLEHFADLSEQVADRAARKAVRTFRRGASVGFAILTLGLIGAVTFNSHDSGKQQDAIVNSGRAVAVQSCNRDFLLIQRLDKANKQNYERGNITKAARQEAHRFYQDALPDCRESADLLTDDFDKKMTTLVPLYAEKAK